MSTVPLSEAPKSAQSALALLEERTKVVLGDRPPPDQGGGVGSGYFNELYPVRYVDSQKMSESGRGLIQEHTTDATGEEQISMTMASRAWARLYRLCPWVWAPP